MKTLSSLGIMGLVVLLLASQGWCQDTWRDAAGGAVLRDCQATVAEMDGQRLTPAAQAQSAHCLGRIEGLLATHYLTLERTGMPPWFCVPPAVSVGQVIRAAVRYMEAHPERSEWQATHLLFTALSEAFPCQGR
jgi:hypothetical protein